MNSCSRFSRDSRLQGSNKLTKYIKHFAACSASIGAPQPTQPTPPEICNFWSARRKSWRHMHIRERFCACSHLCLHSSRGMSQVQADSHTQTLSHWRAQRQFTHAPTKLVDVVTLCFFLCGSTYWNRAYCHKHKFSGPYPLAGREQRAFSNVIKLKSTGQLFPSMPFAALVRGR